MCALGSDRLTQACHIASMIGSYPNEPPLRKSWQRNLHHCQDQIKSCVYGAWFPGACCVSGRSAGMAAAPGALSEIKSTAGETALLRPWQKFRMRNGVCVVRGIQLLGALYFPAAWMQRGGSYTWNESSVFKNWNFQELLLLSFNLY